MTGWKCLRLRSDETVGDRLAMRLRSDETIKVSGTTIGSRCLERQRHSDQKVFSIGLKMGYAGAWAVVVVVIIILFLLLLAVAWVGSGPTVEYVDRQEGHLSPRPDQYSPRGQGGWNNTGIIEFTV